MTPAIGITILVVIALFAAFLILYTRRKERERTEALQRAAEASGLVFEPLPDLAAVRSLGDVQLFSRGSSRRATNLMTGRLDNVQIAVFDYRYTTGSGKHQQTHLQTVVMLPALKPALPDLQMAPENPLIAIAEVFGYQDIDIESAPEFSRAYILRGPDVDAIRAALYPNATSYFGEHRGWTVEALSGTVALYRSGRRPKADDVRMFVEEALAAARSL
jgi:hypothetical protein